MVDQGSSLKRSRSVREAFACVAGVSQPCPSRLPAPVRPRAPNPAPVQFRSPPPHPAPCPRPPAPASPAPAPAPQPPPRPPPHSSPAPSPPISPQLLAPAGGCRIYFALPSVAGPASTGSGAGASTRTARSRWNSREATEAHGHAWYRHVCDVQRRNFAPQPPPEATEAHGHAWYRTCMSCVAVLVPSPSPQPPPPSPRFSPRPPNKPQLLRRQHWHRPGGCRIYFGVPAASTGSSGGTGPAGVAGSASAGPAACTGSGAGGFGRTARSRWNSS